MKLLITGGAGFIGSNFIRYWLTKYPADKIVNLDALTYAGNLENLKDITGNPHYTFVKGNICEAKLVDSLIADVDLVIHFAAESHVDRSIIGPEAFLETNVKGTFILLEAARKYGKRFHHISTDEVFGALALDDARKFTENTPYNPHSPYAASKAAADHLVRAYHDTYQMPVTITNCSNNFGPYQHPEKFIPRMITELLEGRTAKIYGDGLYVRDWLYVLDHCRAIDVVLKKGMPGATYLVGGMTQDINNLQLAKMIVEYIDGPASAAGDPLKRIEFVKDRPGHDRRYAVDWNTIHAKLGWQPEHSFAEWLQQTVSWYRDNEWWWKPLKAKAEEIYKKT